jgi:phenylpyruvate tautomerase PptA (4-oxalocrotonate tautomerase family)
MPVVDIEIVVPPNATVAAGLAQALADAVGDTLGSPPGQTWVRLQLLPREHYAENHSSLDASDLPAFVRLLQRQPVEGLARATEAAALTCAIAQILGRPSDRVHIEYAPAAAGRVAFAGNLVR